MSRILRLLRNPRGPDRPCSLGAAQAAMRTLAKVEDSTSLSGCVVATGSTTASGRKDGWQWSRPLVPGSRQSSIRGSFECLLPLAWRRTAHLLLSGRCTHRCMLCHIYPRTYDRSAKPYYPSPMSDCETSIQRTELPSSSTANPHSADAVAAPRLSSV
jgi:hypothetical protein